MKFQLIWQRLKSIANTRSRESGKSHQVQLGGNLTFEKSLLAHKLMRKPPLPKALDVNVAEQAIETEESIQLYSKREGSAQVERVPIEGVRKSSTRGPSIAADQFEDGSYTMSIQGRGAQGEAGTLEVARVLVQRKNQDGEGWSEPEAVNDGSHVDARAKRGRDTLDIQVVRSETRAPFWRDLNVAGEAADSGTTDRTVESIRAAIGSKGTDKKISGDRSGLVLALNALQTPQHSLSLTAEAFRKTYGEWASSLGFKEIWIVGGSPALTHRLDSN